MGKGNDGLSRAQRRGDVPLPERAVPVVPSKADKRFDEAMTTGMLMQMLALIGFAGVWMFFPVRIAVWVGFFTALAGWLLMVAATMWFKIYRSPRSFLAMMSAFSSVLATFALANFADPWWIGPIAGVILLAAGVVWFIAHPVAEGA